MTKARTSGRGFRSNRRPTLLPRSIAPVPPVEIAPENRGPTWLAGQWRADRDVLSAEAYTIDTIAKLELFLLFLSWGATPIAIFRMAKTQARDGLAPTPRCKGGADHTRQDFDKTLFEIRAPHRRYLLMEAVRELHDVASVVLSCRPHIDGVWIPA